MACPVGVLRELELVVPAYAPISRDRGVGAGLPGVEAYRRSPEGGSNSPYSFDLSWVSTFPWFGTENRRCLVFHTTFGQAWRWVTGTDPRIP